MPTIPETCEFNVEHDQIELKTATNGDFIEIRGISLGKNAAAALAWLVNTDIPLSMKIKIKT